MEGLYQRSFPSRNHRQHSFFHNLLSYHILLPPIYDIIFLSFFNFHAR